MTKKIRSTASSPAIHSHLCGMQVSETKTSGEPSRSPIYFCTFQTVMIRGEQSGLASRFSFFTPPI